MSLSQFFALRKEHTFLCQKLHFDYCRYVLFKFHTNKQKNHKQGSTNVSAV